MNSHQDYPPAPARRTPSPAQIERACHPTTTDRALTALGWYAPELTGAAITAGAAATVWAPLGLITAALGVRIVADRVRLARRTRQVTAERTATPTDGNADPDSHTDTTETARPERDHSDEEVA